MASSVPNSPLEPRRLATSDTLRSVSPRNRELSSPRASKSKRILSIDTPGFHRVDKNGDEVEFVRVFLIGDQKSFADLRPLVQNFLIRQDSSRCRFYLTRAGEEKLLEESMLVNETMPPSMVGAKLLFREPLKPEGVPSPRSPRAAGQSSQSARSASELANSTMAQEGSPPPPPPELAPPPPPYLLPPSPTASPRSIAASPRSTLGVSTAAVHGLDSQMKQPNADVGGSSPRGRLAPSPRSPRAVFKNSQLISVEVAGSSREFQVKLASEDNGAFTTAEHVLDQLPKPLKRLSGSSSRSPAGRVLFARAADSQMHQSHDASCKLMKSADLVWPQLQAGRSLWAAPDPVLLTSAFEAFFAQQIPWRALRAILCWRVRAKRLAAETARKQRIAALTSTSPASSAKSPQSPPSNADADRAAAQMIEQAKGDILQSRKGRDETHDAGGQSKVKQTRPESNPGSSEDSKAKAAKNAAQPATAKSPKTKAKKGAKKEQLATQESKAAARAAKRAQKGEASSDTELAQTLVADGATADKAEETDTKITTLSPEDRSVSTENPKPKGACRSCAAGCFLM